VKLLTSRKIAHSTIFLPLFFFNNTCLQLYERKTSLFTGRNRVHRGAQRCDQSTVLGAFAKYVTKSDYQPCHVYPSVSPHVANWIPLDGFLWNLMYEYFLKICRENSNFIKSDKNNRYFTWKTCECTFIIVSRWILLRMRNLSDKCLQKIKTHI
jgi:hypothetical protein